MAKLLRVALNEYRRHALNKRFIWVLLSVPLMIGLSAGLGMLIESLEDNDAPLGYVDLAGALADPLPAPPRVGSSGADMVELIPYDSEEEARAALDASQIQAYYLIPADYPANNQVELVYHEPPGDNATRQFWDFLQINQIADLEPEIARRAVAGTNMIVRWPGDTPEGGREFSSATILNTLLPLFMVIAFAILFMSSAGYLAQAVVEEKENRTMEILVTSVSPNQLMVGKVLGVIGVSLTQLAAWIAFGVLVIHIGGDTLGLDVFKNVQLDVGMMVQMAAIGIPTYVMLAGLTTAIGATLAESQEAQQVTALLMLPLMAPVYLLVVLVENPDGPLAIGMSLFPFTAMTTMSMRMVLMRIPLWQMIASIALLILSAAATLWLAGRVFRLGMLRYGQRVNLREVFTRGEAR